MTALDTGTPDLLATVDDGVAVLTLHRPERRNALTVAMLDALGRLLPQLDADDDVGAVVLTGAGGAFCAGGDVKGFAERIADQVPAGQERRQRESQKATSGRLWHMTTPTVAALPGPAAGAGLSLALACDLRYAASTAVLTTAFARVGLSGDYGSAWFLVRLVGPARAKELLYLSERLSAGEAAGMGLVNARRPGGGAARPRARRRPPAGARPSPGAGGDEGERRGGAVPALRRLRRRGGHPAPGLLHHRGPRRGRPGLRGQARAGLPGPLNRSHSARETARRRATGRGKVAAPPSASSTQVVRQTS